MKKENRVSPRVLEESWKKVRPQLTKQIMEENPDKPLEVIRAMKQMDEINHQMTELLTSSFAYFDQVQDMVKFHETARESARLQKQKQKKKTATHLEILPDTTFTKDE